ncbi:MAG: NAD-dependent epimerase/dehydratase family protein [Salaquimonas sp.]|jgi:dihydroflavonol-4-reductase|nr:NAD-dependent epimerase/dehydratase family protein [Salaquimonas sp.]
MADTVLVTGVSGFLGGHVALQLLKEGYQVRGSVRDLKRSDKVRDTMARHGADTKGLEFVALDLLRDEGWQEAMKGVRYVQHIASPFVISMPKDPQELIRPAVQGNERALGAAFASEVEHVVVTSSMAAIMYRHAKPRSETFTGEDWTETDSPLANAYIRSKTLSERRAWEIAEEAGRRDDLTMVNPAGIYGPLLDEDPGTSALLLIRLLRGEMPGVPRMIIPAIDARDVTKVHIEAMRNGAGGKRLPMSAGGISVLEMAQAMRETFPENAKKLPKLQLPDWFVRFYALFDKDVRDNLAELGPERKIDASGARALLGRDFISAKESVLATAETIIDQKLV